MEPSDFLPAFLPKKVGRNVGFCLIPTFCTTFLPKMLEEKLYMMWPVKTNLPSEFSRWAREGGPPQAAYCFRVDYKKIINARKYQKEVIILSWLRICLSVVGLGIFN